MTFETILYEKQGRKAIITFNRPEALNAVSQQMNSELTAAFSHFKEDTDLWVAILTGTGERAFSVGADLKQTAERIRSGTTPRLPYKSVGFITRHANLFKPIIAAVNGYALGAGLEMALASDIRIAAERAEFGLPEVRWSLIAAAGGCTRLPRHVPRAVAMKMLLTGQRINAGQALQWGLVTEVVPPAKLLPRAHEIADRIVSNSPLAVQACKEIALRSEDIPLDQGLTLENTFLLNLVPTEDHSEGPRAFAEKRMPFFKGQ